MVTRRTSARLAAAAALAATLLSTWNARVDAADSRLCSTTLCLANGDTECDRMTSRCPACMYAISGGFSCYDKINGVCPYPDVLATCSSKPVSATEVSVAPSLTPTPTLTPALSPAPATSSDLSPATVVPPRIDTPPATTVVSSATSPPATTRPAAPSLTPTPSPSPRDDAPMSQGSHLNPLLNSPTVKTAPSETMTSGDRNRGSTAPATSAPSTAATSATPSANTPSATESTEVLDSTNTLGTDRSPAMVVNIGVIVAAVGATAVVALFVVRRVRQQRFGAGFLATPNDDDFSLHVDARRTQGGVRAFRTPTRACGPTDNGNGNGGSGAAASFAAGLVAGAGGGRRISRANSSPDLPSLLSMVSLSSSTTEFVHHQPQYQQHQSYSQHSYSQSSQFSVAQDAESSMGSSGNSSSSNSSDGSSLHHYSHVSTSSSTLGISQLNSSGGSTRPQQIDEDTDAAFYSNRKQSVGAALVAMPLPLVRSGSAPLVTVSAGAGAGSRPVHRPVYQVPMVRHVSGDIYDDEYEYDIVRPGALHDCDRRNTETLVEDGRFHSNFSEHDVQTVQNRFFTARELEI